MNRRLVAILWTITLFALSALSVACSDGPKGKGTRGAAPKIITNSIGMEFILVRPGTFIMGDALREQCGTCRAMPDETPRHRVTISRPFYLGRTEVTQAQWMALMKQNPSRFRGKGRPVEYVSWVKAQMFIIALNKREKTRAYRLPTEAEWEYAARAGTRTNYPFGDDDGRLSEFGWYASNAGAKTRKVARLGENPWGFFDMQGNVQEWCQDWYDRNWYRKSPATDPLGPPSGTTKVRRGGFWGSHARSCRVSARTHFSPEERSANTGFRLVMMAP